jgi:hypothetical protein
MKSFVTKTFFGFGILIFGFVAPFAAQASPQHPQYVFTIDAQPGEPPVRIGLDLRLRPSWAEFLISPTEHRVYFAKEGEDFQLLSRGIIRTLSVPKDLRKELRTCLRNIGIQLIDYEPNTDQYPLVEMTLQGPEPVSTLLILPWLDFFEDGSVRNSGYTSFPLPYRHDQYQKLSVRTLYSFFLGPVSVVSVGVQSSSGLQGRTFIYRPGLKNRIALDYRFRSSFRLKPHDNTFIDIEDEQEEVRVQVAHVYYSNVDPVFRRTTKVPVEVREAQELRDLAGSAAQLSAQWVPLLARVDDLIAHLTTTPTQNEEARLTALERLQSFRAQVIDFQNSNGVESCAAKLQSEASSVNANPHVVTVSE